MKVVEPGKESLCPACGNPIKCSEPIACLNAFHDQEPEVFVEPKNRAFYDSLNDVMARLRMPF